jgi:hypothetical protein
MPKILLSYRRSDSQAMAGRVFDWLVHHYGEESIFIDIDDIPIGTDFRAYIAKHMSAADLVLAVIGPRWLGPRENAPNRIYDADDPVAIEVQSALAQSIPIIPVLVDGARMPGRVDLPENLSEFASINAATVDVGRDFRQHMDRLRRAIDTIAAERNATKQPPKTAAEAWRRRAVFAVLGAVAVVAGLAGVWSLSGRAPPPPAPREVPLAKIELPKAEEQRPPVVSPPAQTEAVTPAPPAPAVLAEPQPAAAPAPPVLSAEEKQAAVRRDEEAYARVIRASADNVYGACEDYLKAFPAGTHVEQCKAKMLAYDEQQWEMVRMTSAARRRTSSQSYDSTRPIPLANYERYLRRLPNGRHAAEARAAMDDIQVFDAARKTNTEAALNDYLARFPKGLRAEEARNIMSTVARREKEMMEKRLAGCVTYAKQALSFVEQGVKESCNLTGPRWVAEQQPHIDWCMSARPEDLRRDTSERKAAIDGCTGPRRERDAWEKASAQNTIESMRVYLNSWRNGANAEVAAAKLEELCEARWPQAKRVATWDELGLFAAAACRDTTNSKEATTLRDVKDDAAWNRALSLNSRKGFEEYVAATGGDATVDLSAIDANNPDIEFKRPSDGKHADDATSAIADFLRWEAAEKANTMAAYEAYLNASTPGRFEPIATQRKAALGQKIRDAWSAAERAKTKAGYEVYLQMVGCRAPVPRPLVANVKTCGDYNVTEARQRLVELAMFADAERTNDPNAYSSYLALYPDGLKASIAKERCRCTP